MIEAGREGGGAAGRITALTPDPRHAGAVRVEVDGRPFATVTQESAAAEGLAVGRALDPGLRERLGAAADVEAAFRTGLRALERRSFARADLGRRLQRKGHPRQAVAAALDRLAARGFLDDLKFALTYVETRAVRGRGPSRLTRDLLAMGVERRLIDRALAAHAAEGNGQAEVPLALALRRSAQLGDLPRQVKRRRLLAFLARRGFAGREVGDIVRQVVEEEAGTVNGER